MSLKPTLDMEDTLKARNDSKYSGTFGFSHGAGGRGAGTTIAPKTIKNLKLKNDKE